MAFYDADKIEVSAMAFALSQVVPWGRSFDEYLALCSHHLLLYSEQLSTEFHLQAIRELCRVASEVRIFPLLELNSRKSSQGG